MSCVDESSEGDPCFLCIVCIGFVVTIVNSVGFFSPHWIKYINGKDNETDLCSGIVYNLHCPDDIQGIVGFAGLMMLTSIKSERPDSNFGWSFYINISTCSFIILQGFLSSKYKTELPGRFCKFYRNDLFWKFKCLQGKTNFCRVTSTDAAKTTVKGKVEAPEVSDKEIRRNLLRFCWPKDDWKIRRKVIYTVSSLFVSKGLTMGVPFIFKHLVDFLNEKKLTLDDPVSTVTTHGIMLVLAYGAARLGAVFFSELRNYIFSSVAQESMRRESTKVLQKMLFMDHQFHASKTTPEICKAIDRGTKGMHQMLRMLVVNIFPSVLEVLMVAGILGYRFGPTFAGITSGTIVVYVIYTLWYTERRNEIKRRMNLAENRANNKATDSLLNYEIVKLFNNEVFEAMEYNKLQADYMKHRQQLNESLAKLNTGQTLIFSVGLVALMALTTKSIIQGTATVGDLVMVNGLLFQLAFQLNFVGSTYREMAESNIDMKRMFSLMKMDTTIKSAPDAPALKVTPQTTAIEFENVKFSYDGQHQILKGLSFSLQPGKKIGIVGGSGTGKSTIAKMLYRFFDPDEGRVLINGQCIKDVDIESLRKVIGVVPQDCNLLFNDTLYNNLSYGDLTKSSEDVYEAARIARLPVKLMKMLEDKETSVGEHGGKLSGGEKQRVAIARMILKNPMIIIYDEATSSLDTITEQKILSTLKSITKNKTTLVIAHRLSTIVDADEIIVLQNGKVAEKGSHFELLSNKNSFYYDLWHKQYTLSVTNESDETDVNSEDINKDNELDFTEEVNMNNKEENEKCR